MTPPAKNPGSRPRLFRSRWKLVASVIGFGVSIGWLADAINDGPLFQKLLWSDCLMAPFCVSSTLVQTLLSTLFALVLSLIAAYHLYTEYSKGKVVQLQEPGTRHYKVLIMWLSTGEENESIETTDTDQWRATWVDRSGKPAATAWLTQDLYHDAQQESTKAWNMWQVLRAVKPHVGDLHSLHLLVTKKSQVRVSFTRDLLRSYFKLHAHVSIEDTLIDEHDIAGQIKKVGELIARHTREKTPEDDIVVDCTCGPKTSSIAAACATLNNPIALQYVSTDPKDLEDPDAAKVKTYQLVYMAAQN